MVMSLLVDGVDNVVADITTMSATTLLQLSFLAYPATLLGLRVWNDLLARLPAATVTPFALLVPVTGMLCGRVFLGEVITTFELIGGVLVMIGLTVTLVRKRPKP
jgi:O-acetylserine/cysteine efflux transporter